MDEPVATDVRRKKKSSLIVWTKLVTEERADDFVSAGNTGAAMVTAKMVIGMLPGVDRPALAAMIPTKGSKPTLLLDVGATDVCKAHHLTQFAIMGDTYSRSVLGKQLDYVEYGGVSLLGIRQIVMIGHGSSNARAIRNAVRDM